MSTIKKNIDSKLGIVYMCVNYKKCECMEDSYLYIKYFYIAYKVSFQKPALK